MKVLVNATPLVIGGGVQVAASFIAESVRNAEGIDWHYAVSHQVSKALESLDVAPANCTVFDESPARDAQAKQQLLDHEQAVSPDVVFTVFGPAYVRFKAPHLCGVAVGWVTHSTWRAFRKLPGWGERIRVFLKCWYKAYWLKFADHWVVEAANARSGLHSRVRIPLDAIDIVENTCAAVFEEAEVVPSTAPAPNETVRLLYVSAYYPHKNIEFIPDVAAELQRRDPDRAYEFVITLPESEPGLHKVMARAQALGVTDRVRNVGPVSLKQIIELYQDAHLCFMPSLLETFSATYPEAMALGRPIITTDLDFAHAVCRDAAVYFAPDDPVSAAAAIADLAADPDRWAACIASGNRVLQGLPNARRKYGLYVEALRATASRPGG